MFNDVYFFNWCFAVNVSSTSHDLKNQHSIAKDISFFSELASGSIFRSQITANEHKTQVKTCLSQHEHFNEHEIAKLLPTKVFVSKMFML